jgi:glycosyltransferase involved in cell wall biosynthesis
MEKVTITLPVYNGMPFVKDAVESVLGQTYRDFRFLIIDDGSRDGSREYLTSLKDPRPGDWAESGLGKHPERAVH